MFMRRLKMRPNVSQALKSTRVGPLTSTPIVTQTEKLLDIPPLTINVDDTIKMEVSDDSFIKIEDSQESGIDDSYAPLPIVPAETGDSSLGLLDLSPILPPNSIKSNITCNSMIMTCETIEESFMLTNGKVETILEEPTVLIDCNETGTIIIDDTIDGTIILDETITSVPNDHVVQRTYDSFTPCLEETSNFHAQNEVVSRQIPVKVPKRKPEREIKKPRRHFNKAKEPPERSKMTMVDLIYYNPTDNPMKTEKKKNPQTEVSEKEVSPSTPVQEVANSSNYEPVVAPRVKIDEYGQIVIDEESLIIKHAVPESYSTVTEDSETTYFSFRTRTAFRKWTTKETLSFYKALMIVGTDFALMSQLIKNRSREELKLKYKKEEKKHAELVHKIVRSSNMSDYADYQQEIEDASETNISNKSKKSKKQKKPTEEAQPGSKPPPKPKKKGRRGRKKKQADEVLIEAEEISLDDPNSTEPFSEETNITVDHSSQSDNLMWSEDSAGVR